MYFSLIISGRVCDLFKDETISLTRQLKDLQNLNSVYTDFTQSFQIPASGNNNQIFQNFFDENVLLGSWNQNDGLPSQILIHGLPVFEGVVELMEVNFNNGLPSTYTINFYGKGKQTAISWGETTMRQVDWSSYDHTIDNATVQSSWLGGLLSGDVVWDLKDYGYGFTYSEGNISNNIRKANTLDFYDLRPSIKMKAVLQTLFDYIGITLTGSLLDRPEFATLFITPMDKAGPMVDPFDAQYGNVEANNLAPSTLNPSPLWLADWSTFPLGSNAVLNPSGAWNTATYTYTIPRTGDYTFTFVINSVSIPNSQISIKWVVNGKATSYSRSNQSSVWVNDTQVLTLTRLSKGDQVQLLYKVDLSVDITGTFRCIKSPYSLNPMVTMADAFPNTKVVDFVNSFLLMTNSVLVPVSDTEIEIHNMQDWYDLGTSKEWTQYIDFKTITHKKVPIPKNITMKHQGAESQSHKYFVSQFERPFGDLEFSPLVDFTSDSLDIETIFTVFPPTIIYEVDNRGVYRRDTELQWMGCFDSDVKATQHDYILFHFQPPAPNSYFYLGSTWLMTSPTSSVFSGSTASSYSCAFGIEGSLSGDTPTNTLYFLYWNKYISRLFSTRSRIIVVNINLPVGEWLNMKLNDTIAISGNYYKIQSIQYDINREYGSIELLSYPDVQFLQVSGSTGNRPVFTDPVATDGGQTFIRGVETKLKIANAVYDGTDYISIPLEVGSVTSSVMTLTDNYLPTISLNKITIYEEMTSPQSFTPVPVGVQMSDYATEGDATKYTPTAAGGFVTIETDGQYVMYGSVTIDNSGGHDLVFIICVDGQRTEAYSEVDGNHKHTLNLRASSTLGKGQKVQLMAYSNDGGSHTIDVLKASLTIESKI